MLQKITLYYHTIKHLRWIQIRYQLWYRLRSKWRRITKYKYNFEWSLPDFQWVSMATSIEDYTSYLGNNRFRFLNIEHRFDEKIDWDIPDYGKLWTYNLNYFDFLSQENSNQYQSEYHDLIHDFILKLPKLKNANEPFPTSLRIINWVKYFMTHDIDDQKWNTSLFCQCYLLKDNIECHLMGNHLLENGFALTLSGIYFQDTTLYSNGKNILESELHEQVLKDGAHFELSPMYHCLILHRLLDTIHILKSNIALINSKMGNQDTFLGNLIVKAEKMCGWIQAMMYEDGSYPHFNDSTDGIAPKPYDLIKHAEYLGIYSTSGQLSDSGFRRIKNQTFDLTIKAGKIGPDYIPGHAHADSLSFVCFIDNQPVLVDPGISTYEKNHQRQKERQTSSHNTVTIHNMDSSQVWGGFRVGKRASTTIMNETSSSISAEHNGFDSHHQRDIEMENNVITITDTIPSKKAEAHFHFHPDITLKIDQKRIHFNNLAYLEFLNVGEIRSEVYQFSQGFNHTVASSKVIVSFSDHLKTTIRKI
jgi:hypothetical protein